MKHKIQLMSLFMLFLFFGHIVLAGEPQIAKEDATKALDNARKIIDDMVSDGFNVQRVNDTLFEADQIFIAQSTLGDKADYALIMEKTSEIKEVSKKAYDVNDELSALKLKLDSETGDMTEAYALFETAKQEFYDERYEISLEKIEEVYSKISELQALQTKLKAIADAGKGLFFRVFVDHWLGWTIFIIVLSLLIIILQRPVRTWIINRKMDDLKFERDILKGLIQKTQKEYFELGNVPESVYSIRTKKFGELIRDINRRIPLLEEKKEQVKGNKAIKKSMDKFPEEKPKKGLTFKKDKSKKPSLDVPTPTFQRYSKTKRSKADKNIKNKGTPILKEDSKISVPKFDKYQKIKKDKIKKK